MLKQPLTGKKGLLVYDPYSKRQGASMIMCSFHFLSCTHAADYIYDKAIYKLRSIPQPHCVFYV